MAAIWADDVFKCIFLNENDRILIQCSLEYISRGSIDNKPALVHVMDCTGQAKSNYLDQWWPSSLTHICGTRGRWVNMICLVYILRSPTHGNTVFLDPGHCLNQRWLVCCCSNSRGHATNSTGMWYYIDICTRICCFSVCIVLIMLLFSCDLFPHIWSELLHCHLGSQRIAWGVVKISCWGEIWLFS